MDFPLGSVIEAFTGTDGTTPVNSNWSNDVLLKGSRGIKIASNEGIGNTASVFNTAWYNAATFGPDVEAWVTIPTVPALATDAVGILLRIVTPGTGTASGYSLLARKQAAVDTIEMNRTDNTVDTLLSPSVTQEFAAGDAFGLQAIGPYLTAFYKPSGGPWSSLFTRYDSTYTAAGYVALAIDNSSGKVDGFGAGSIVTATEVGRFANPGFPLSRAA